MLQHVLIAVITMSLICTISLPLHVLVRRLSLRHTVADPRFWAATITTSVLVALLVASSD